MLLKHDFILLWLLCVFTGTFAQDSTYQKHYTRSIAWTAPVSKSTTINGVAFGLMTTTWKDSRYLKVNGMNLELSPLNAIVSMYAIAGALLPSFSKKGKTSPFDVLGSPTVYPDSSSGTYTVINGLSFSAGGISADMKGLGFNGLVSWATHVHGLEITGIMNAHYDFRGVIIAGLRNKTTTGKGLQIGLINVSKGGRMVQIGLFNRIGRRIIPFVNCSLKKPSTPPTPATAALPPPQISL